MVQRPCTQQFRTKDGDEIPFEKGEGGFGTSGSKWTTKELNWLAVCFQDDCEPEDVFSPETKLSGQIVEYVRSELLADERLDWSQLRERRHNAPHFYARLLHLETQEEKQPYYSPSAGTGTQASSAQKDIQSQRSPSQTSESSSAYDRQLSITPTPRPVPLKMHKGPKSFATGSPPLGSRPSRSPEFRKVTRASRRALPKKNSMKNLYGVRGPTGPWSGETNRPINSSMLGSAKHAGTPAGSLSESSPKEMTFLAANYPAWETSSDPANTDHSSQASSSGSESESDDYDEDEEEDDDVYDAEDDKYESDVLNAAQAFSYMLEDAFKSVVQDLPLATKSPRRLDLLIEGVPMTSHPDLSLCLATKASNTSKKDPEIEVVIECKRKNNKLSANRKLGQEFSELLGDVKRQWAYGKPRDVYTAYLLSWHHFECYVSRLDVTQEYLDKLEKDTARLQKGPHPLVKRSRKFELTNSDQRLEFALLAAHLLIHQMTMYKRHKELVRRLLG